VELARAEAAIIGVAQIVPEKSFKKENVGRKENQCSLRGTAYDHDLGLERYGG